MLIVNAFYDDIHEKYFNKLEFAGFAEPAFVTAYVKGGGNFVRIPHGSIVLALEGSVAPFFESDRIRCLWDERVVFIKRKALNKINVSESF